MSEHIRGRILAQNIREKVKSQVEKLNQPPGLAVILVGENPASQLYVSLKEQAAKEAGIFVERREFEENVTTKELVEVIHALNDREDIHGILVQLPLPEQDEDAVINALKPEKDVDGFHRVNRERLKNGEPSLSPPVALSIMKLISATNQPLSGKEALVLGNSEIFAEAIIELGKDLGISTEFVTKDNPIHIPKMKEADILIVAIGEMHYVKPEMIKEGSIIIDVGTNKIDGKTTGDVSPDVMGKAGFVSPVPGGVGPLTVAYLLLNVVKAAILFSTPKAKE